MTYDQWKTESGYAEKTPEQENEGRDCPAKTKSFRDRKGNRFIFPSLIIYPDDEKSPSETDVIFEAMMLSVALRLDKDDDWFEFDPNDFPNIRTTALSSAFAHGGATVLMFAGPDFEAAKATS